MFNADNKIKATMFMADNINGEWKVGARYGDDSKEWITVKDENIAQQVLGELGDHGIVYVVNGDKVFHDKDEAAGYVFEAAEMTIWDFEHMLMQDPDEYRLFEAQEMGYTTALDQWMDNFGEEVEDEIGYLESGETYIAEAAEKFEVACLRNWKRANN